jgi:hypothetical protein
MRVTSEIHKGGIARAVKRLAVSYPGVGRFHRAETGILGVEQTGGPTGPPYFLRFRFLVIPRTALASAEIQIVVCH